MYYLYSECSPILAARCTFCGKPSVFWIKAKMLHCESVAQHQAERKRWLVETTWKEAATSKSSGWKVSALDKLFLTGCALSCSVCLVMFEYKHWGDSTQSRWTRQRRKTSIKCETYWKKAFIAWTTQMTVTVLCLSVRYTLFNCVLKWLSRRILSYKTNLIVWTGPAVLSPAMWRLMLLLVI